jgi:transcription factor SFP1
MPSSTTIMPAAAPIDISTSRQSSGSPSSRQSNLTTQLQQSNSQEQERERYLSNMPAPERPAALEVKGRQDSVSMLGTTPYGARQIPSANGLARRESAYGLSGSLMGGMSWGGISMGSFIRDE